MRLKFETDCTYYAKIAACALFIVYFNITLCVVVPDLIIYVPAE